MEGTGGAMCGELAIGDRPVWDRDAGRGPAPIASAKFSSRGVCGPELGAVDSEYEESNEDACDKRWRCDGDQEPRRDDSDSLRDETDDALEML